jgi:hypothetical protein
MGTRMPQEAETELRGSATKNSQQAPEPELNKITIRTPEQIQTATRKELESLSDIASEQFFEAVKTRTEEKLAYRILNGADTIAKGASAKVLDFLPKVLNPENLMGDSELDQFLALVEAA